MQSGKLLGGNGREDNEREAGLESLLIETSRGMEVAGWRKKGGEKSRTSTGKQFIPVTRSSKLGRQTRR